MRVAVDNKEFYDTEVNVLSQDNDKCALNKVEDGTESASCHTVLVHPNAALKNCRNSTVNVNDITVDADHARRYLKAIFVGNIKNRPMSVVAKCQ